MRIATVHLFTCTSVGSGRPLDINVTLRAVPEIIRGGDAGTFLSYGGRVFVDVSEGWGWGGNLSWGSRHI